MVLTEAHDLNSLTFDISFERTICVSHAYLKTFGSTKPPTNDARLTPLIFLCETKKTTLSTMTTTTTASEKLAPSSAETSLKIKQLLKELPEERADAARLDELRRLFAKLVSSGQLSFDTNNTTEKDSPRAKWNAHLLKQHKVFVSQLCHCIQRGRKTAIRTLFGVIAASPQNHGVNQQLVHLWVKSIPNHVDKAIQNMVQGEFLQPHTDVQYSVLVSITKLAAQQHQSEESTRGAEEMENNAERLFQLLLMIPIPKSLEEMEQSKYLFEPLTQVNDEDDSDDESSVATSNHSSGDNDQDSSDDESTSDDDQDTLQALGKRKRETQSPAKRLVAKRYNAHKKALAHAWLAVLKLPALPTPALKMALQFLPSHILPHVPNPLLFADFFMQAYQYTGSSSSSVISVLSLDGLFLLMTQYGLEYPLFYTSLYRLLQPSVLYVKYRTKFLELLTKCLVANDMLPGHLVAAFVKRALRAALVAPPPGILVSLALAANLLRKYPECASLIHRDETNGMDKDPFDAETNDPTQTRG